MPSPDLNFLAAEGLAGDFADDAAGELGELGHVFAQILRLLLGALDCNSLSRIGARTMISAWCSMR
jgi:hypothetical protein